jgi:hypothetical protein
MGKNLSQLYLDVRCDTVLEEPAVFRGDFIFAPWGTE